MERTVFWHLDRPDSLKKRAEWDDDEVDMEGIVCLRDDGHQRAGRRTTDLSIFLRGGTDDDFVWTWYSECLIQDHVLKLFKEKHFTGFTVKRVRARYKRDTQQQPPELWELVLNGWGGIAPPKSGIRLVEQCDACGFLTYSGYTKPEELINESQWDGSDFFMVWPLPRYVFVTERVVETIRDAKLTGVRIVALKDLKPTDGHSPGRLSYSMPEARAHEIGIPLGIY